MNYPSDYQLSFKKKHSLMNQPDKAVSMIPQFYKNTSTFLKKSLFVGGLWGLIFSFPAVLLADETTWTGNSSGFWGTSSNWTNNQPNLTRDAIFDETASRFSIDLGARDRSVSNLTIDSTTPYAFTDNAPGEILGLGNVNVLSGTDHIFILDIVLENGTVSVWDIASGAAVEASRGISGNLGLTKEGEGNLIFGDENTYTGGTIINGGSVTIEQGNTNGLSNTDVTLGSGTQLIFDDQGGGDSYNVGTLNGSGDIDVGGGIVVIGGDVSDGDFSGGLIDTNGGGGAVKTGTNSWTLTNSENSVERLRIEGGTVTLGNVQALENSAVGMTVDNGLNLNGFSTVTLGGLSGSGDLDAGTTDLTLNVSGTENHTGNLSVDGSLTKTGCGSQTIANLSNTVTSVTVDNGELAIAGSVFTNIDIATNGTFRANGVLGKEPTGTGTLAANGNLLVGDGTSTNGYAFGGTLEVGSHAVTLLDADKAELGSATTLTGGSLTSSNGILLADGDTLSGFGTVNNTFTNDGSVDGSGVGLVFSNNVDGSGDFTGTVTFDGIYSPGNSPAEVSLEDVTFNLVLEIELGGLVQGTEYDFLNISGDAVLGGVLDLSYLNDFSASDGDDFLFLSGAYSGTFDNVIFPDAQDWYISYGGGGVSIGVIPEPTTYTLLLVGLGYLVLRRRLN